MRISKFFIIGIVLLRTSVFRTQGHPQITSHVKGECVDEMTFCNRGWIISFLS